MKIVIANGQEDWSGLYIDGTLRHEDHSLRLMTVLELIQEVGGPIESLTRFVLDDAAERTLNDLGNLPETLDELRSWSKEQP